MAFHPSSRTPHTLVPSHAACTLWTGPVTVTSRAAGVKKLGICSPSAMGLAPFRGVEPSNVPFPPRLESCTFAPVSTQTSKLTDFGWMYGAFPLKSATLLVDKIPEVPGGLQEIPALSSDERGRRWFVFFSARYSHMEVLSPTLKKSMPEEGDVQMFIFFWCLLFVVVFCCQCVFSFLWFRGHVVGSEVVVVRRFGFAHRNYCRKSFQWCEQLRCQWLQNRLNSWTCLHRNKKRPAQKSQIWHEVLWTERQFQK